MDELEAALRAHGQRVTRPRRLLWEVLAGNPDHRSAQALAEEVRARDPRVNVSSVYRSLALFSELGLVRESRIDPDASTWEATHADAVIHLVCDRCGAVVHHATPQIERLRQQLARDPGFEAAHIDVRVTGVCRRCS
jgi:Fe2+ or Zn2+ uptake regulation protein